MILYKLGYIDIHPLDRHIPLLFFACGSVLLGSVTAICVGKLIINPVRGIGEAFEELSRGNFSVKVSENQPIAEMRDIARQFNRMTYDLSHMEELSNDFITNVSHEFKTPISAIEGYATLLQNPKLSAQKHDRYVEKILENSKRLSNMSGKILLLSKLENRETIPDQSEFRLDEQIRRCVLSLEEKWGEKQIEFDIHLQRIVYFGSCALLEQVWINILDNAIKHSPPGGRIEIKSSCGEGFVRISVADGGDGIPPEAQEHIFDKFYQADTSHTEDGNGLGLALVKRILDMCAGDISVESALGEGAEFTVSLPWDEA